MSQQTENGLKTFTAGEVLEAYRRVKLSAGSGSQVEYADSDEACIGITQKKAEAIGDMVTVALITTGRTFKVTANEAMAAGAPIYAGADGKVQDTDPGAGTIRGTALEATTADGDIIEAIMGS